MTRASDDLNAGDLAALAALGITPEEARRQVQILRDPPAPLRLIRPCTPGDGVLVLGAAEARELAAEHEQVAAEGRVMKFVPASGAATRMFRDLLAVRGERCPRTRDELRARVDAGEVEATTLLRFVDEIGRFAFADRLGRTLAERGRDLTQLAAAGPFDEILEALLDPAGLDYARAPKGLLPFHRYGREARTAVEEHLVEAALLTGDREGRGRVHLTVSPQDRAAFVEIVERARPRVGRELGVRLEVAFSEQHPSTQTIALDERRTPFRDAAGALVLRPGGHGALLENLADLDGDLVHVKNIDNVAVERIARPGLAWKQVLVGLAARLRRESGGHLARIEVSRPDAQNVTAALAFARERYGIEPPDREPAGLAALLRRPLRVCGVVRSTGEPGGGPFWVLGRDGRASRQIVESAQVDEGSEEQRAILASATHFNPVDMVLALRCAGGHRPELRRHVDPDAVFVAWKSWQGKDLLALERPGLWNGAMADWNTVFVEIPGETFTPVKTVLDLLRPEHQR